MKLTELRVNQVETPMGFQITPLSFPGKWWKQERRRDRNGQVSVSGGMRDRRKRRSSTADRMKMQTAWTIR